jgi:hypothetical protein
MYVIQCLVTGGKTGTREGLLKEWGEVAHFDSYEEAEAKAAALRKRRAFKNYATAPYFYYAVRRLQSTNGPN